MNINDKIHEALEHHQKANLKQAEELYNNILKIHPDNFYALHYLGVLCMQRGNFDLAIEYIKRAVEINPSDANAYYNLGIAFQSKGQLNDAISAYQKTLQLNPINADAHVNLGNIFKDTARFDEAITSYQQALQINPDHSAAYNNMGTVFKQRGRLDDAIASYKKAFDLTPDYPGIILNLGTALREQNRFDEAISVFERALSTTPDSPEILFHLGTALMEYEKKEQALNAFEGVLKSRPNAFHARLAHCIAQIPIVHTDALSISLSREKYHDELTRLHSMARYMNKEEIEAASNAIGTIQPFYLAYQGLNDRELQQIYGELICRIMKLRYPQFAEHSRMPYHASGEPIRVGFVSGHFYNHSVWKIPAKGWLQQMDKRRFELYGYYTWWKKDEETETARKSCKRFVEDVNSFEELCRCIRDDNIHVLVFPEIGMDPITLRLAALRLAPVQCASWGHPTTSGLPTIDYYLSSDLMEPPDADRHYTEKLIRLPHLSSYYSPVHMQKKQVDRKMFGIRKDSVIYHCCQSIYKYLPQYDTIFTEIAREVENCQFLFSSHPRSDWLTKQFRERIYDTFNKSNLHADDFVVFLPFLDLHSYNALYKLADVFLDPVGWSGCNSALEAISCDLPIVTLPGNLMRSRDGFAILTMMDVKDTIAAGLNEYVTLAVKLGKDSAWRQYISKKIASHKHHIYNDRTCITALEYFFERAVKES